MARYGKSPSSQIWTKMEDLLNKSISQSSNMEVGSLIKELSDLISKAIEIIEKDSKSTKLKSFQSFGADFINNTQLIKQNSLKNLEQLTSLQEGYMFLDRAYELISGNKTEFTITSTVIGSDSKEYEFYKKTIPLKDVMLKTNTFQEGNFLIKSTIDNLRTEIRKEENKVRLSGNALKTYQTFLSLTKVKGGGFNEGHASEAIQRYLMDVESGKQISQETLMKNLVDSMQRTAFYKGGDLSRTAGDLSTTIETQIKNLGEKTNILTVGNTNTILNGLRKFQAILNSGAVGEQLQQQLQESMFSPDEKENKLNAIMEVEATKAIEDLFASFNLEQFNTS